LSQPNQFPPARTQRNILILIGGLIGLLLLGVSAGWYIVRVARESGPTLVPTPPVDSVVSPPIGTDAQETPQEIPEAAPEDEAPGTPSPNFTDNFEARIGPAWKVLYGDAFVEGGRLTSNVGSGLAAGDTTWENYQIDFDVDTSQVECLFTDTSNSVGVRVKDFDHAYWFVFTNCNAAWSRFAGGVNQGLRDIFPDTLVNTAKGKKHITIKVEETKMSAYENGTLLSAIIDPSFRTGGIFLQVEAQTYYDNFEVTLMP